MYDQNFKNQAVKEHINGSSVSATARKFNVSVAALRGWIENYKEQISMMESSEELKPKEKPVLKETISKANLSAVTINIDGNDITLERHVVERLMDIFKNYDK